MPTRLVDGEGYAGSDKLERCSLPAQAWYGLFITLALGNGSFEANARNITGKLFYKLSHGTMTPDQVEMILAEYERERLLVLWTASDGKRWGFYTAIERRLPPLSELKKYHHKLGEWVPAAKLAKMLGQPKEKVLTELAYRFADVKDMPYLNELRRCRQRLDKVKTVASKV